MDGPVDAGWTRSSGSRVGCPGGGGPKCCATSLSELRPSGGPASAETFVLSGSDGLPLAVGASCDVPVRAGGARCRRPAMTLRPGWTDFPSSGADSATCTGPRRGATLPGTLWSAERAAGGGPAGPGAEGLCAGCVTAGCGLGASAGGRGDVVGGVPDGRPAADGMALRSSWPGLLAGGGGGGLTGSGLLAPGNVGSGGGGGVAAAEAGAG